MTKSIAEALVVQSGETRLENPLDIFGDHMLLKLTGRDTAGQLTVMLSAILPNAGPPLHKHSREDESFYVLEGEFVFESDGKRFRAGQGCFVSLARGTVHTFQNVSGKLGKLLILAQPAGVEDFFVELDQATQGTKEPDIAALSRIFAKYGLEFMGPPIAARPAEDAASAS
jgi:quercetin dioxygenase-like cupin family protein